MKLEGIHHITAITGDAQHNVDFYAGTLGLRMVKKTVNQDQPSVYHLFYADEQGSPGADLTFFEFRGAPRGRAGVGMVHRIGWRVGSAEALDFWAQRLGAAGHESAARRRQPALRRSGGARARARHRRERRPAPDRRPPGGSRRDGAARVRLRPRLLGPSPQRSAPLLDALEFEPTEEGWEVRGSERGGTWHYDEPPSERGLEGAGTVHHIAWASTMDEHMDWRERALAGGARPTPVIDRFWFRSIYFREPSGVLFEIATLGPGFGVDEDPEHLGEKLILPPFLEDRREEIEAVLVPVENPRAATRR